MKRSIAFATLLLCSACSSPTAPSKNEPVQVDKMAAFAALHSHEVCVRATRYIPGTNWYEEYAVLIPLSVWASNSVYIVLPMSLCNPAE